MNREADDVMALLSHHYSNIIKTIEPQQQVGTPKRRHRGRRGSRTTGTMRNKRILSVEQKGMLEESFGNEQKLETERKEKLAAELGLEPRQVAVWFQNRRARWRTKKMEDNYSNLQYDHKIVVLEKGVLQAEIMKLKKQLKEAEKEIQRLLQCRRWLTSNSPISSSSLSMDTNVVDPSFLNESLGVEGLENVLYPPWMSNYDDNSEWHNFNFYFM